MCVRARAHTRLSLVRHQDDELSYALGKQAREAAGEAGGGMAAGVLGRLGFARGFLFWTYSFV